MRKALWLSAAVSLLASSGCVAPSALKELVHHDDPEPAEKPANDFDPQKQQEEDAAMLARAKQPDPEYDALAAKAKTMKTLVVPELGISMRVPGDVELHPQAEGEDSPSFVASGEVSQFWAVIANAKNDYRSLEGRIVQFHRAYDNSHVEVLQQDQKSNGSFEVRLKVIPEAGDYQQYYFFAHHVLGARKVNCLSNNYHFDQTEELDRVQKACQSIRLSSRVAKK